MLKWVPTHSMGPSPWLWYLLESTIYSGGGDRVVPVRGGVHALPHLLHPARLPGQGRGRQNITWVINHQNIIRWTIRLSWSISLVNDVPPLPQLHRAIIKWSIVNTVFLLWSITFLVRIQIWTSQCHLHFFIHWLLVGDTMTKSLFVSSKALCGWRMVPTQRLYY